LLRIKAGEFVKTIKSFQTLAFLLSGLEFRWLSPAKRISTQGLSVAVSKCCCGIKMALAMGKTRTNTSVVLFVSLAP
jgi:hypothetical protein